LVVINGLGDGDGAATASVVSILLRLFRRNIIYVPDCPAILPLLHTSCVCMFVGAAMERVFYLVNTIDNRTSM
jgi:hypothetical protein